MKLTPNGGAGVVELVAIKLADACLWFGHQVHARYAVAPAGLPVDELAIRFLQWRSATQSFCLHGDPLRFSQRRMFKAGVCSRQTWQTYTDLLCAAGVMVKVHRAGCYFAAGWDRHKLGVMLRRGMLTLPFPLESDPPPLFDTRGAATQKAQHTQTPQLSAAAVWAKDVEGVGRSGAGAKLRREP